MAISGTMVDDILNAIADAGYEMRWINHIHAPGGDVKEAEVFYNEGSGDLWAVARFNHTELKVIPYQGSASALSVNCPERHTDMPENRRPAILVAMAKGFAKYSAR